MAANFWSSSHRKQWIFTKEQLELCHKRDKEEFKYTDGELKTLTNFFTREIQAIGKRLGLRQRAIGTAAVVFRRFYAKNNFVEFCPRLVAPTCLYVSTKAEECSTQVPASRIASETKKHDNSWPYSMNNLLECEFYILETVGFCLIVFHPYKPLLDFIKDCKQEKTVMESAWNMINDTYCTDLSLLYPPYVIALACIYLAAFVNGVDMRAWFVELDVDMKEIWNAACELLDYYESQKQESQQMIAQLLKRLPTFPHFNASTNNNNNTTYPPSHPHHTQVVNPHNMVPARSGPSQISSITASIPSSNNNANSVTGITQTIKTSKVTTLR